VASKPVKFRKLIIYSN